MNLSISGTAHSGFEQLVTEFKRIQRPDQLGGSALAVYHRGEKVVDLWTGVANIGQDWQENTMALSYSTGKGVLATLVHRLVDQGLLDYDTPIIDYWPAFGAHSQHRPTLRHVLCHESGLYDIRHVIRAAVVMLDWQAMLTAYEQATPRFASGADVAYQALSFGWILGGLIEQVTHEPLAVTLQRELVEPLGLDGAYFGVPEDQLTRVARPFRAFEPIKKNTLSYDNIAATASTQPSGGLRPLTFTEELMQLTGRDPYDFDDAMKPRKIGQFDFFSNRALRACIPAANGVFTARALAKVYAMLAAKGNIDQQVFLRPQVFESLSSVQNAKRDRVMPIPMRWRLGYHRLLTLGKRTPHGFGHMGYNGSGAWCDPSRELSFAYVHSYSSGSLAGDYRQLWLTQRTLQMADKLAKGRAGWF